MVVTAEAVAIAAVAGLVVAVGLAAAAGLVVAAGLAAAVGLAARKTALWGLGLH
jgi:hypothetical protein